VTNVHSKCAAKLPAPARLRLSPDVRIQQILDAAQVEFYERGFAAARMDDIARRCGLSKGGLYAHFNGKDEVFEALLARSLTPPDLQGMSQLSRTVTVPEMVEWLVDRLHEFLARPAALATLRLLVAESGRVPHIAARWQREVVEPYLAMLAALLQKNAAQGGGSSSVVVRDPWLAVAPVVYAMVSCLVFGNDHEGGLAGYREGHVALLCELLDPPTWPQAVVQQPLVPDPVERAGPLP